MKIKRALVLLFTLVVPLGIVLWMMSLLSVGPAPDLPRAYAAGTVITVTTSSDNTGVNSLRDAINTANADSSTDVITITFDDDYTIALGSPLPNLARASGPTVILGDRGTGTPRTTIDASSLTPTGGGYPSALRVTGDGWRIQGVAIIDGAADAFGVTIRGHHNELLNSHIGLDSSGALTGPNRTGVLVTAGASHNLIDGNIIASNLNHGVSLYSTYYTPTQIITPSHHNTVTHNYIGTNPAGADLGNGNKGVIIQVGSHDNYVFDNVIAHNTSFGVYLYGYLNAIPDRIYPPTGNRVVSNTLTMNDDNLFTYQRGAIVSDRTHQAADNAIPSASSGFDNVIASNLITGNLSAGIYNVGASPLITDNRVLNNSRYGIYNIAYFGASYDPDQYEDDILSIPYIANNTIDGNGNTGILSLDTAPARRYELTTNLNNTIGDNGTGEGQLDVSQAWYAGVEVLTGTLTSQIPITDDAAVQIYKGDQSVVYNLSHNDEISGTVIWNKRADATYRETDKWTQVREFAVQVDGTLDRWLTHTVQVQVDDITGTVTFAFDGLTSTKPLSDFVGLPNHRVTGPYARYQIAEWNYAYDCDQDTIPDVVEGGGDTDNDGIPDFQDPDSDGDNVPDSVEGDGDTDGDGIPDWQDPDDDGDGVPTEDEDIDDDGDPTNDDTDGDGIPDYLDPDDDGDGVLTEDEDIDDDGDPTNDDTDGDGIPDYLDPDDDGDGVPTEDEDVDGDDDPTNDDSDGDGIPDYLDPDDDGDGVPTEDEDVDGDDDPTNDDSDGDGIPDYLDPDDDGDGIPTEDEDVDGDGDPTNDDTDGDGIPDYRDTDSNNNGIPDSDESGLDADGDGDVDADDCPYGASDPRCTDDTDGDGIPDWLDPDQNDTDGDGIPDPLDTDADGDGTHDSCQANPPQVYAPDQDCDGIPDWQDTDNDNDGIPDHEELDAGTVASPECPDGVPGAHGATETDSDGDGAPDCLETDTDDDGIPDYMDPDADGDGEDDCSGLYPDADCDGIPNHLDLDSDGDGTPDSVDGTGDDDDDGIPNFLDPYYHIYLPLVLRNS